MKDKLTEEKQQLKDDCLYALWEDSLEDEK